MLIALGREQLATYDIGKRVELGVARARNKTQATALELNISNPYRVNVK